jgi:hypothetical protein
MDGAEASYTGHSRCGSLMVALQGGQPVSAVVPNRQQVRVSR